MFLRERSNKIALFLQPLEHKAGAHAADRAHAVGDSGSSMLFLKCTLINFCK